MSTEETTPDPGTQLALTGKDAEETRVQALDAQIAATEQLRALQELQAQEMEKLEQAKALIEAEFQRKRDELATQIAPLKKQLKQFQEVLWTVNLYLGRDEAITQIKEGAPAPRDTPISIRQRVLSMAEESLIHLDHKAGRGITSDDVHLFFDWVTAAPENLARILPEQKGVVVLIPTKITTKSGNIFEDAARDEENRQSYWLIRNGDNLYTLRTDIRLTSRILPRRDEFTEIFEKRLWGYGPTSTPVVPGSDEWLAMEERASATQRHYMRVLLVLQGLLDRTTVWNPLPEGGVSFLSLRDQDRGRIVLVQDEDPSMQIGDGKESFLQFRRRLNQQLRVGMRVILATNSDDFRDLREGGQYWRHTRITPASADYPDVLTPYLIEDRRAGGLVIRYDRSDTIEKRNVPVEGKPGWVYPVKSVQAQRRASLLIYPTDTWVMPFDLITEDELNYYLTSRENRSEDLLGMVPLIKAALKIKQAEREAEAPFRELLARTLAQKGYTGNVDRLIHNWKVQNTYARALNGDPTHEAKAARGILKAAQYEVKADKEAPKMVDKARTLVPTAIAVAYQPSPTSRWVAVAPTEPGSMFCDIHTISPNGTVSSVEREVFMGYKLRSRLVTRWSTDEWDKILSSPQQEHEALSLTEKSEAVSQVLALAADAGVAPVAVTHLYDKNGEYHIFRVVWFTDNADFQRLTLIVKRDRRTGQLTTEKRDATSAVYGNLYSAQGLGMSVPWADSSHAHYKDSRHRLIWSDDEQMERVKEHDANAKKQREIRDQAYLEHRKVVRQWTKHIEQSVRDRLIADERARFLKDYGTRVEHLWEGHLKTRQGAPSMKAPWRNVSQLETKVSDCLHKDRSPAGLTLKELLDTALTREDLAGFVVPDLPEEEEGVEE